MRDSEVPLLSASQVSPLFVVLSIVPFEPTTQPVRLLTNVTAMRDSEVLLSSASQVSPLFVVLSIVPFEPTTQPVERFGERHGHEGF